MNFDKFFRDRLAPYIIVLLAGLMVIWSLMAVLHAGMDMVTP